MNIRQHKFVTAYIRYGDKIIAYREAYKSKSTNYRALESAANRLLQNPEIAAVIEDVMYNARREAEEKLKIRMQEEVMTCYEKRIMLKKITYGRIWVEKTYPGKNCSQCTVINSTSVRERLSSIDMDNRMGGDYVDKRTRSRNKRQQIAPEAEEPKKPGTPPNRDEQQNTRQPVKVEKPKKKKFRNKPQQIDPETPHQPASQPQTIPVRVEQYNGKPRHIITDKHLREILYPEKIKME